jgi:hypothetical protein
VLDEVHRLEPQRLDPPSEARHPDGIGDNSRSVRWQHGDEHGGTITA